LSLVPAVDCSGAGVGGAGMTSVPQKVSVQRPWWYTEEAVHWWYLYESRVYENMSRVWYSALVVPPTDAQAGGLGILPLRRIVMVEGPTHHLLCLLGLY
jgi:hypothetical protein